MKWDLPIAIEINGKKHKIRNNCDYRVVLDVITVLNDEELDEELRMECALFVFYDEFVIPENINSELIKVFETADNIHIAITEMLKIINLGDEVKEEDNSPRLMDWEYDFTQLAPPISRVLGYSVRESNNYTHWYDFIGAFNEIGESVFSTIISIREKRTQGKKLDDWEKDFYKKNKKIVDLPHNMTNEEREWLDSDW